MDEKTLAEELSSGKTEALKSIIARYSSYVRTITRNISHGILSNEDTDEVTSDVFYRLWKHRENIKSELGLHSYISAITRSVVKNRLRRVAPTAEDISELDLSSDFDVENIALLNDMTACLNEGLNTLTTDDREIFLRYYLYGETSPQIAKVMNISENTIYSKLRRTKAKLKEFLSERGYDNV